MVEAGGRVPPVVEFEIFSGFRELFFLGQYFCVDHGA
jgi:hypothetical protein